MRLAAEADPGFERGMFACALSALRRIPDQALTHHGLGRDEVGDLRARFRDWERLLASHRR
ncbi:hypothetical protein HNP84_002838 [Thermocatellispora tengchongensis]|uniref:Uncharacterized protein n=2 Tax=Thermocatellispora tengchongensis TaxID=1073253 RepID=A0A840P7C3_9ACTN|nr:hypothetical protein [Thermocatellispora tengchongensis]